VHFEFFHLEEQTLEAMMSPMSLDYPKHNEISNHPECRWTPRAIKVLSTAKAIAVPVGHIEAEHLLLAFESVALEDGENVASQALARAGIRPSVALGRPAPGSCPPNSYVSLAEFGPSLSGVFPSLVIEEATAMGNDYVGLEHLLLFLARAGVPGVKLPYEPIRQTILELTGRS
jgi:hypothetical protein